jgi:mono/diheme cytochrome c family protein
MSVQHTQTVLVIALITLFLASSGVAMAGARRGEHFSERWCSQCHGVKPNQASPYAAAPSGSTLTPVSRAGLFR